MGSIKERYGKNYILCDTDGKGKIRNPLQIVKSWENKVNYITEDVVTFSNFSAKRLQHV